MEYVALLRGINVGGKNKISMPELKKCFEGLGLTEVTTYINSGNVVFKTERPGKEIVKEIETTLPQKFKFEGSLRKVLILAKPQLKTVVEKAPEGFGMEPDKYHSDVIFLIGEAPEEVIKQIEVNPEVDAVWAGDGVLYYRRLSAELTKSRLSKIVGKPIYQNMTIRTWNTTNKLLKLMNSR